MIRILTQSLGTQQYAAYAIFGGLLGWFCLTDMGLGASLQNHISERRAKGESYDQFIAASAVLGFLSLLFFAMVLFASSGFLGSTVLRKFVFFSYDEKRSNFLIFGLMSIAAAIGGISYRIWFAEQKGYLANLFPAIASVASFIFVVAVSISNKAHSLFWMIIAGFGPSAVLPLVVLVIQVARKATPVKLKMDIVQPLAKRGLKFWLTGLLASGVLQVDYLIMSQYLKPSEIVIYNLASKIFLLVYFIYASLLTAIWPNCAEAFSTNSWDAIFGYVRKCLLAGFILVVIGTLIFVMFKNKIIGVLSPKEVVNVPVSLILLLGCYYLLRVWCDTFAMILQSMSYLKPFVVYIPVQAALNITVQIVLTKKIGLTGVLFGLIISFVLTPVWILPFMVLRKRRQQMEMFHKC